ncbi:SDR family oxidoreductase [Paraflavitalea sp. CAU 1676]|uniref:SDR family oxidoreductase n=1 Tax=Paraflavitalea sp. CAU 1676 TaxID=3032598 RepID=UPI0023DAEEE8|nr:SDR family oxidoreductase [Paraflavitalea sp. CAU 1676]MDF2187621.1 SDR family oxidoreductase [Paraflavitalea sp. CAU 1676]
MSTVLILGAASDMAVAIAKKYASQGHAVQLAARNVQRLKALESDIAIRYNTTCTAHEFDALNFASHQAFFDALSVKPDITICVFGYLGDNEVARGNWAESERIIHTNYTGAVSILNVVSNYYAAQKKGVIAGISSVAGERGRQSNYIYGSAKAGFTAYLSGLRNRMFHEQVHVVSVQPGFVYTRMTENLTLPPLLTAQPELVADTVFKAVANKKNVVYVKWFWRWIMLIIKSIPEFMFKKLKL